MQRTDLRKKQPTVWPWAIGAVVFVSILWSVSDLLAPPAGEESATVPPTVIDSFPPAAIPSPPEATRAATVRSAEELSFLDESHIGTVVRAEGEVLATGNTGFWMLVGSEVVRVDSERTVRKNDTVAVEAVVQPAAGERTDRIASEVLERSPRSERWQVVRAIKLVDRSGGGPTG